MTRLFVVGTDTGVGKTEMACALLSLLADAGHEPAPFKPYESGVEASGPADALALRLAARSDDPVDLICPHRFAEPLAPGVAAERLGIEPSFDVTLSALRSFDNRALVVEAAGGLRVPIDSKRDVIDLLVETKLPAVLVARAGLGTLNHTALSLDLLEARGVPVAAVVLVKSSPGNDLSEEDNARLIARRHGVRVLGPVAFCEDAAVRRRAFREALEPLLFKSR